jgi:hypothetical protein
MQDQFPPQGKINHRVTGKTGDPVQEIPKLAGIEEILLP